MWILQAPSLPVCVNFTKQFTLRSWQLFSWQRIPLSIMQSGWALLCSQEPAILKMFLPPYFPVTFVRSFTIILSSTCEQWCTLLSPCSSWFDQHESTYHGVHHHAGHSTLLIRYDTIFIYCSWVSSRWQWSLWFYTKGNNTNKYKEKEGRSQNTQNRKQDI